MPQFKVELHKMTDVDKTKTCETWTQMRDMETNDTNMMIWQIWKIEHWYGMDIPIIDKYWYNMIQFMDKANPKKVGYQYAVK